MTVSDGEDSETSTISAAVSVEFEVLYKVVFDVTASCDSITVTGEDEVSHEFVNGEIGSLKAGTYEVYIVAEGYLDYSGKIVVEPMDDSTVIQTFEIEMEAIEPELPPFIPFPDDEKGDPVEVGSIDQGGSSSSDDGNDTLKVVACAAAVVIAVILIIVWATTYRND